MTVGNTFEILIPTFNGERYLALCLLALSRSTTRDFSVRIGPEGTWKGGAELEAFCERLALPVVISQAHERIGLAANRARLLGESRSDYVLWLDDDVLVSPDSIAKLLSHSGTLGARNCLLTGVGSNLFGHPTVTCGLGFTLFRRDLLIGDPVLDHPFGINTGEDCLWTARIAYKSGLPVGFVPTQLHHIGENRRRKRYGVHWDGSIVRLYTSAEFYDSNREELDYSHPVYNYMDY